jgi:hypothetical protein
VHSAPKPQPNNPDNFYHEGHEEHEVQKFSNIDVRNLRVRSLPRAESKGELRGEKGFRRSLNGRPLMSVRVSPEEKPTILRLFFPQIFKLLDRAWREAGVVIVEKRVGFDAFVDDLL